MESIALMIIGIILALVILIECITKFIREIKLSTKKSCKLKNGFEAKISVMPIATKKEVCAKDTTPLSLTEKRA